MDQWKLNPNQSCMDLEDETIITSEDQGCFLGLQGIDREIYKLFKSNIVQTRDSILAALCKESGGDYLRTVSLLDESLKDLAMNYIIIKN